MIDTIAAVLDWGGIVVFATTGALAASRRQMDVFGFVLLSVAVGIGGGTVRDLVLGLAPVFWVRQPAYMLVCVAVGCVMFFLAHIPQSRMRVLLWLDAVGLALFAVIGAEKTLAAGFSPSIAVAMGVVTATFGGIIRDILAGETPVILSREIYVTAALLAALVFVMANWFGLPRPTGLVAGFVAGFGLRALALHRGWSLPRYKPRPPRSLDGN